MRTEPRVRPPCYSFSAACHSRATRDCQRPCSRVIHYLRIGQLFKFLEGPFTSAKFLENQFISRRKPSITSRNGGAYLFPEPSRGLWTGV